MPVASGVLDERVTAFDLARGEPAVVGEQAVADEPDIAHQQDRDREARQRGRRIASGSAMVFGTCSSDSRMNAWYAPTRWVAKPQMNSSDSGTVSARNTSTRPLPAPVAKVVREHEADRELGDAERDQDPDVQLVLAAAFGIGARRDQVREHAILSPCPDSSANASAFLVPADSSTAILVLASFLFIAWRIVVRWLSKVPATRILHLAGWCATVLRCADTF